jgi:predicted nucleic acid-binding protein
VAPCCGIHPIRSRSREISRTKDDYLVALAVVAQADALISGDRDLTDLQDPPVPVLTPRTFLVRLDESKGR